MSHWYCIRTQRYKEQWVSRQLLDLGKEYYLPLLRERRIVRRQWKDVIEPLFPCYLFVHCQEGRDFAVVRTLFGVQAVVSSVEHGPIPVDEGIIRTLHDRTVDGYIAVSPPVVNPGDELEVIAGPFQGLDALFHQELKGGERVAVLLRILSSLVRVDLPRTYVRKKAVTTDWRPAV
ncbi:MAG: transcription termination/antitermination protein NusG [Candidatus Binatia bacterium]